jgi:hypothetical protein
VSELIGYGALRRRFDAIKDNRHLMGQIAGKVVEEAALLAPVKTGNLRRSIRIGSVTDNSAEVVVGAAYGAHIEFGTKAHRIVPRNKKSLFFPSQRAVTERFGSGAQLKFRKSGSLTSGSMRKFGNAAFVHSKWANIPARQARPFLVPGAQRAIAKLDLASTIIKPWNEAA